MEGKDVFHNVLAVEKVTPARLSLNVGPQPLRAGTKNALLLISISNVRDDGEIKLNPGDTIKISMPNSIGSNLKCGDQIAIESGNNLVLDYQVPSEITIKAHDFSSIFAILCSFVVADTQQPTITGLITAELGSEANPGYEFIAEKEKDVPITQPLGILYDPFDRVCSGCGKGVFNRCDEAECHGIEKDEVTNMTGKCWYDSTAIDPVSRLLKRQACMSCGEATEERDYCLQFLTENDCIKESKHCSFSCKWHPLKEGEKIPASAGGAKKEIYNGWCESTTVLLGECKDIPSSRREAYNKYASTIENKISKYGLDKYGINANALVAAIITQESSWNERKVGDEGRSIGLMQINVNAHPECDAERIKSFDVNENIDCGVRFLSTLFAEHFNDPPKLYKCKNVQYSGIKAILRYYNGWPDKCSGDPNYVENVYPKYEAWDACFKQQVALKPGDIDYCKWRKENTLDLCTEGEGLCNSNDECDQSLSIEEDGKRYNLECRDPGMGKKVCCYKQKTELGEALEQSNQICRSKIKFQI
jgi:hypothetical protein